MTLHHPRCISFLAPRLRLAISILVVGLVSVLPCNSAQAQATPAADRVDQLSAFGSVSRIYTDYGQRDAGFTLGGDFTRFYRFVAPSIEARYVHSTGDAVTENSFLGGIKAERGFRRFHPYADFLVGYGTINFVGATDGYTHDNSVAYDIGAGLDYRVTSRFSVKFDAQQQYWKLGSANNELEPYNVSVGVTYRIPFGWRRRE